MPTHIARWGNVATREQKWQVLQTPGHHPGHICLLGDAGLVAGDMVAGIGTILIPPSEGDMDQYLQQLQRLIDLKPHLFSQVMDR